MKWIFGLLMVAALVAPVTGQDAQRLIEKARIAATLQNTDLNGKIRSGSSSYPVALFLRGEDIQFQYAVNGNWQPFHMRLGDDQYNLFEMRNGETHRFPQNKLGQSIAGTDLTYEDLSLRFFYWPNPELLGSDMVGMSDTWRVRLRNPGRGGNYGTVDVWVHQEYGAFMKVIAYDRRGQPVKQFEVDEVMKLDDGSYTLEKMKVSSFEGGRVSGNSYLEFDKPERRGPRGMR